MEGDAYSKKVQKYVSFPFCVNSFSFLYKFYVF